MLIPFRKKVSAVGWRPDELSECYRVVGLLARSGLPVSIDSGVTDEGEPWAIVLREDTGDVLLHMARLDEAFVVVSAAGPVAQRGESLRAVLDTAVRTGRLAMLTRRSAAADSDILRLHPATLIAAFIAGAWFHTQSSQAALLDAGARREEVGTGRVDDARLAGFAALPPAAALATAAASFAAVAANLHATQTTLFLEVTSEDFIQAALELVVDKGGEVSGSTAFPDAAFLHAAPVEVANLELRQSGLIVSAATVGEPTASEARPDDARTGAGLEAVATPATTPPPGAGDIQRFFVQHLDGTLSPGPIWDLTWGAADEHSLATGPLYIAGSAPAEASSRPASASHPAVETLQHVRPAPVAEPSPPPIQEEESAHVIKATSPVSPVPANEVDLRLAHSRDTATMFFKSAAQILHLDALVTPMGADVSDSSGPISRSTPAASEVTPVPASVSADAGSALTSASSPAPPAPDADVSGGSRPLTAAVQPAPPSNAQLLLEFTNGAEHVVHVNPGGLTRPIQGQLETGSASKVVVVDAPWLEVKSFMLMPGVMMMEDDLLGGVNRAGLEMKGSPVSLDLGDGLTITLLGVLDLGLT